MGHGVAGRAPRHSDHELAHQMLPKPLPGLTPAAHTSPAQCRGLRKAQPKHRCALCEFATVACAGCEVYQDRTVLLRGQGRGAQEADRKSVTREEGCRGGGGRDRKGVTSGHATRAERAFGESATTNKGMYIAPNGGIKPYQPPKACRPKLGVLIGLSAVAGGCAAWPKVPKAYQVGVQHDVRWLDVTVAVLQLRQGCYGRQHRQADDGCSAICDRALHLLRAAVLEQLQSRLAQQRHHHQHMLPGFKQALHLHTKSK